MSKRTGRATAGAAIAAALIGIAAGVVVGLIALAAVAPDVIPEIGSSQSGSRLYEDGSYVVSVGEISLTGCAPIHPWNNELVTGWCLDGGNSELGYFKRGAWVWTVGVDSPWEDFTPRPIADLLYWFVETFIKSRYQNH